MEGHNQSSKAVFRCTVPKNSASLSVVDETATEMALTYHHTLAPHVCLGQYSTGPGLLLTTDNYCNQELHICGSL